MLYFEARLRSKMSTFESNWWLCYPVQLRAIDMYCAVETFFHFASHRFRVFNSISLPLSKQIKLTINNDLIKLSLSIQLVNRHKRSHILLELERLLQLSWMFSFYRKTIPRVLCQNLYIKIYELFHIVFNKRKVYKKIKQINYFLPTQTIT